MQAIIFFMCAQVEIGGYMNQILQFETLRIIGVCSWQGIALFGEMYDKIWEAVSVGKVKQDHGL